MKKLHDLLNGVVGICCGISCINGLNEHYKISIVFLSIGLFVTLMKTICYDN